MRRSTLWKVIGTSPADRRGESGREEDRAEILLAADRIPDPQAALEALNVVDPEIDSVKAIMFKTDSVVVR
jgi:hypothetical protein